MEWIRRMNLKKALFTITFLHLLAAVLLSAISFQICQWICSELSPPGTWFRINYDAFVVEEHGEMASPQIAAVVDFFAVLQILLPVFFFVMAMTAAAFQFYRLKLAKPLDILTRSTNRIMNHDLDFSVEGEGEDELGQLCAAFETMRRSLLENNRRLWQQAEERRRLNAAFSHDLRNPVTMLKGSVKMARECAERISAEGKEPAGIGREGEPAERKEPAGRCVEKSDTVAGPVSEEGARERKLLLENLARMEDYTCRVERYVETMSSVGRLEEIAAQKVPVDWDHITADLERAVRMMASEYGRELLFSSIGEGELLLDRNMLFQITENLLSNAVRFARRQIVIRIHLTWSELWLEVADDGTGFPDALLKNGVRPFQKGSSDPGHFGMGLYICDLLCRKHGGRLSIENGQPGAKICAVLRIS